MKNLYQRIEATIENIVVETPTIKTFTLHPQAPISFKTGQFVEVTVPGIGEAPFTPSSHPEIGETLDTTVMNVGRVSSELHKMNKGDRIGLRGPYGVGYPVSDLQGKEILVVGGGVGLAPLRSLMLTLLSNIGNFKKVFLRYGARSPKDIVYKNELGEWAKKQGVDVVITVDKAEDGWKGNVGVVTTILEDLKIDTEEAKAIVCGPPVMMKFTTFKLLEKGFSPDNILLSMEKNMSCGVGKCGHCRLGNFYVCKDGPVFYYDKIKDIIEGIWE
jgi:sulfite reductase subunit B